MLLLQCVTRATPTTWRWTPNPLVLIFSLTGKSCHAKIFLSRGHVLPNLRNLNDCQRISMLARRKNLYLILTQAAVCLRPIYLKKKKSRNLFFLRKRQNCQLKKNPLKGMRFPALQIVLLYCQLRAAINLNLPLILSMTSQRRSLNPSHHLS